MSIIDSLLSGPGMGLTAGLGALAGAFPKVQTQKGTSTSTVTTPSEVQPLQGDLLSELQRRLLDPSAGIAPLRLAARNSVNNNYAGFDQALRDKYLAAGMGSSGKFGLATRAGELSRIGSLSDLEGPFAQMQLNQGNNNLSLAQRFLQSQQGTTTATDNKVSSGGGVGGALGGGLQSLFTLFALNKQLSGSGSGNGGGFTGNQTGAW